MTVVTIVMTRVMKMMHEVGWCVCDVCGWGVRVGVGLGSIFDRARIDMRDRLYKNWMAELL